jgi:hypothetical protein
VRDQPAAAPAGTAPAPAARLEPDAIGVARDTVIGMAPSAPGVLAGLTLAALAAAAAYGSGPVIILTAVPMLIIANACRRLNMRNVNCGASFEWVGRAIHPYLGFLTGWLMIAGKRPRPMTRQIPAGLPCRDRAGTAGPGPSRPARQGSRP